MPSEPLPLWPVVHTPENPTLTPYLLPGDRPRAAVVVHPGGGYRMRAPHEGAPIARWLNSLGLHAFVCDYRVAPSRHPAAFDDGQRGVRLVRHHAADWRVDPARVGVLGFSAGGHLVCELGNDGADGDPAAADPVARHSARPDAVIACYAMVSTQAFLSDAIRGAIPNLLGPDPSAEACAAMALELGVTARNPPTFLWSTADDRSVPVEHSLLYAMALRAQKIPFALHVYPSGPHGLGLSPENGPVAAWTHACAEWLAGIGFR